MRRTLAITYLLEDTELFGGVKVVFNQARVMRARGHRVTVVSKGEPPRWVSSPVEFRRVAAFDPHRLPEADITVATYWTTIAAAFRAPSRAAVHYCQGFEAGLPHNAADHEAILEAYRTPMPCFAVSEDLANLVRGRFSRPVRVVPPVLESFWRPRLRRRPHRVPRVVVMHPFEFYMKGVDVALEAVRLLRGSGVKCALVRISQWPLSEAERCLLEADEFHHNVAPRGVARLLRGADLLLAPSWQQEGFGLPVLEAMASGVPIVASDIPAFRGFATRAATLVPFDQPGRFAEEAAAILTDPERWCTMRAAGLEIASMYSAGAVGRIVEDAMLWVVDGRAENGL